MPILIKYLSLIICILGWFIWMLVIRIKDKPLAGIADTGKIMFWVGLLTFLLSK